MTKASDVFTLKNANNIEVTFIGRGGQVIGIKVPDAKGQIADVVIGYENVDAALAGDGYFGALCGRYANRIVEGKFELDGTKYQLDINNEPNHLHGGNDGFNNRVWDVKPYADSKYAQAYKLSIVSPDGDQKYPGELTVSVIYGLTDDNEFVIDYTAETTKPTIINLTSHAYFNLKGAGTGTIENHVLELNADKYTPISAELGTVTGEIAEVKGTAMDFVDAKKIGEACKSDDPQVKLVDGIDHNFVINSYDGRLKLAARLTDSESGREMEVFTDQPGVQIYTGSHFDGTETGKLGTPIVKWAGVALETQIFPDSPNKDHFPNAVLRPGETYKHTCVYKFS
ncbi:aldose epimerase family protein [Saccharicrinis fermentans]|uniref:Aldose 1-epimerase n=1 Tax=Saccharicrinis fermentans DSM 9555 = JCM 21142 TaxID=869213 RepID=W7XY08_9BACT|nr:aldose epimerase family protein [Saccharicrinis fermentans]GAF03460.1 aldose 1-epimerase precursor [Saccharicrinis fermentans DSM 9555 = JCM 21142]